MRIAGMPLVWKLINLSFIIVPKISLWSLTCRAGVHFLLDTSGIVNAVSNCVALDFVLSIDELVFENLTSQDTKDIMGMLQGFNVHEKEPVDTSISEEELLEKEYWGRMNRFHVLGMIPVKLVFVMGLTGMFVADYYMQHCARNKDGVWVPNSLYAPKSLRYSFLEFLLPYFLQPDREEEPFWEMPSEAEES